MSLPPSAPYSLLSYISGLALSFVLLGVTGFLLVRSLKQANAPLMQSHVPALAQIRNITKTTHAGRKTMGTLRSNSSKEARVYARKKFEDTVTKNDRNLAELAGQLREARSVEALTRLKEERADYLKVARQYLANPGAAQTEEEFVENRRHYYAALDSYLNEQDAIASTITDLVMQDNAAVAEKTNYLMLFFTLFAGWPVVVGTGFFLYGLISAAVHYDRNK